ncbi:WhiB family transcriptional regulator [Corynebacterium amycolatum]|uniref:WhiB family transcriptional regulator n=1 Tax=Corynebacterium amycolatum TaxID=43765 RepID=A0AAW9SFI2_CORAY|nr:MULTISPECIES: WhiB family transcriptional regulator [Corynebacterium]MBC6761109.1 hypothetical protein [Corynebacterium sp. LK27]MDK7238056.1 WhiB family transcriptional regulator [Corynebacterium amycolatum]MDK7248059.1 WhiB family transcriptional regulator [Corynebacterium amycolatum]
MDLRVTPGELEELRLIRAVHAALADGLCATGDASPHLWDAAVAGEPRKAVERRYAQAIAICEQCPVRQLCHGLAEALPETSGVWGGEVYEDPTKRAYQSRKTVDGRQRKARLRLKVLVRQRVACDVT